MTSELCTSQKLISSSCVRVVTSRVSVVAGATFDGDLGDFNLWCTRVESTLPTYESYVSMALLRSLLFIGTVRPIGAA